MPDNDDDLRPSWVPKEKNPEFACTVMRGIDSAVNSVTSAKYYPKENLRRVPNSEKRNRC